MQNVLDQQYLWNTVLGVIVAGAGLSVLALSLFRRKRVVTGLVTFGAASLLYGVRLLIGIQLDQYVVSEPPLILLYSSSFITYIIPVPLSAFLLHLFNRGWINSILWVFRVAVLFAFAGIISDLVQSLPFSLNRLNSVLVVIWACLMLGNTIWSGLRINRELKVVLVGFLLFGLLAVNENLVNLDILPWHWKGEALGFLVFLAALGYASAYQFFRNEKQLFTIQQEMETARRIQSSILPSQMPSIQGLEISARYIPMTAVAGDFYDIVLLENRRLCILVADVSGHGVGAALIASMIKIAFASQMQHMSNPSYVLAAMNRTLHDKMGNNFSTAGCLFIDADAKVLHYAGAGHPPLFLWKKSKQKMYELMENGLPIGPFPDAAYSNVNMHIEPGDRILMYTDGIIETTDASGSFFGNDSFKNFIKAHDDVSAELFTNMFLEHLFKWSGKPQGTSLDDDLTLIVIDID